MPFARSPAIVPVAAWRFAPRPSGGSSPADEQEFRAALAAALQVAHGLGVELGMVLRSGPRPSLTLEAYTPKSARWVGRVLAPVYGAHRWAPMPLEEPNRGRAPSLVARRVFAWPEAIGAPGPVMPFLDAAARGLSSTGEGASLRWRWRSVRPGRPGWWKSAPPADPVRTLTPQLPGRHPAARPAALAPVAPPHPLFGRLALNLEFEPESAAGSQREQVRATLETLSRTNRGNMLLFRRPTVARASPAPFWVTLEEWAGFWPRLDCPAGAEPSSPGERTLLPFGRDSTGGVVGMPIEAHQGRHAAVLGETGMGKSSLLVALSRRALSDWGGILFDPLGETSEALGQALTGLANDRLIRISPDAGSFSVNALEGIGPGPGTDPHRSERRLNDLVHALRRVRSGRYEESSYWGPRLEEMLTRALRAAAALPRGTLVDAHTLLETSARLGRPVPPAAVAPVRELADRIREHPEDREGARRLLHEVVRSPVLVRMLCEPEPQGSTRELVAPGRVVLISGSAASVGEATSRYLLSVYLALIWSELLAREANPKTFVVLDEAQWFSHESLGEMLRLGRRRNVHVLLATQAVGSLPASVGEAVWTNVSDFVAFRGAPQEAREFAQASPGVSAEELLALPRGNAAVLLGKGNDVRWIRTARRPADDLDGSRGISGAEPVDRDGGPDGPGPPVAVEPVVGGTPGSAAVDVRTVLGALVRRGASVPPERPLVVELDDLRAECDPTGRSVRILGSLLGRRGLLGTTDGARASGTWVIPPECRPLLGELTAESRGDASRTPQPS